MSNTTTTIWRGYFRRSKREQWRELCSSDDYSSCWGELLAQTADRRGPGGELLVTQSNPNAQAPAPRRRRCF